MISASFGFYFDKDVDPGWVLVMIIGAILVTPLMYRWMAGQFDIFEPIVIFNVAFAAMYIGRPIGLLFSEGPHFFKGDYISGTFYEALAVAIVGTLALQIGYSVTLQGRVREQQRTASKVWNPGATTQFCLILAAGAGLLYGIFILQSGGLSTLAYLLQGRAADQTDLFQNSSAYFYGAPLLFWPASLLLFALGLERGEKRYIFASIILMLPIIILGGSRGSRIQLVPLFGSPLVYYYLRRFRRPSLRTIILVLYILFTVFLGFLRDTREISGVRAAESEVDVFINALTNPLEQVSIIVIDGNSNDMFESLAAMVSQMPEKLEIDPVAYVIGTISKPIPSILWSGKPLAPEQVISTTMYPNEIERASSTPGIVGSFYFGGGYIGVTLGMFAIGLLYKWLWVSWHSRPDDLFWRIILVMSLFFIPIIARGGLGDTFARMLFSIVPVIVAYRWSAIAPVPRRYPPVSRFTMKQSSSVEVSDNGR